MSGYLLKYVGTYRVKADYDLEKNDFIRDKKHNLEKSFDDFYIPCDSGAKIRHYQGKVLFYFCQSIGKFRNVLKQIYTDKVGDLEKFKTYKTDKKGSQIVLFDIDAIQKELINKEILVKIEEYDEEAEFYFKTSMMDYIATMVKAKTAGANISPFSTKNLPNNDKKYDIPLEDLASYKKIISVLERNEVLVIAKTNEQFDDVIRSKKGNKYNVNAERKLSCYKGKEFIHSIGLWDEYLKFLEQNIKNYLDKKHEQ
jgi:hypothetical protein